jgi:tetratricopeptide (TPR) repeat protein
MFVKPASPVTKLISVMLAHSMLVWIVYDLGYTGTLHAQTSALDYLNKGIEYCENFEFDEAITNLNKALGLGGASKEDAIKIHLYLAFCLAAKSEMDRAKSHFLEILKIDPNFTLSYTESAIFLDLFQKAKDEFKQMNPVARIQPEESVQEATVTQKSLQDSLAPQILHVPLETIEAGKELPVSAIITDNEEVASASLLFIREDQRYYRSVPMNAKQGNMYEARITSDWIQPPGISYFIHAVDSAGNEGLWKSPDNPYHLNVYFTANEQLSDVRDSVQPIEAKTAKKGGKTIIWVGLGALVVSGGILAVLLRGGGNNETPSILTDPPPWPN